MVLQVEVYYNKREHMYRDDGLGTEVYGPMVPGRGHLKHYCHAKCKG